MTDHIEQLGCQLLDESAGVRVLFGERSVLFVIEPQDLARVQSHDECLHFCEKQYGAQYATYAAALTGMTPEQFVLYEGGRRQFWDR